MGEKKRPEDVLGGVSPGLKNEHGYDNTTGTVSSKPSRKTLLYESSG
jgi:hypothetical protein